MSWWAWGMIILFALLFILKFVQNKYPKIQNIFTHLERAERNQLEEKERSSPWTKIVEFSTIIDSTEEVRRSKSIGEVMTCRVLEEIYGVPFTSIRADFLVNPETGRNLELDCYNPEVKVAGEYNGSQHTQFPNRFHRTKEEFIAQVRRDKYKVDRCDELGIYLITVPHTIPLGEIKNFIKERLPDR